MKKKLLAAALVVVMAVTMLPVATAATEPTTMADPSISGSSYYGTKTKECTWYALGRYKQLGGEQDLSNLGDAKDWYTKAKARGLRVGTVPEVGAVACWNVDIWDATKKQNGHVAVVEWVSSDKSTIRISQYNRYGKGEFGGADETKNDYKTAFVKNHLERVPNKWNFPPKPTGYIYVKKSTTPANPTFSFNTSLTYIISPQCAPSRCLEVAGQSTANGANVQIGTKKNLTSQQFKFESVGSGYYKIVPQHSKRSLDCKSQGTTAGTNVQQYDFSNNHDSQRWRLEDAGDGYCYIVPKGNTSLRLDVVNGTDKDGTNVQIYTASSSSAQKWKLIPVCNGNHTKGIYRFYEASHPHYNFWQCSACGQNFTDGSTVKMDSCTTCYPPCVSGHSWSGWTVTKAASCGVAGSRKRTCSRCGKADTETIAALSHNYQKTSSTLAYNIFTCSNCKNSYREDKVAWVQSSSGGDGNRSISIRNSGDEALSCCCLVARYQSGRLVSLTQEVFSIPAGASENLAASIPLDTGVETWKVFVLDDQSHAPILPNLEY